MNPNVNIIANRLSLRPPQRESLEILAKVCDVISLEKNADLSAEAAQENVAQSLKVIQTEFPTVMDFERDFPSLCFALATGVGKTRLMGAFIAYLFKAEGIRHFFVLTPNLTIYNKLIAFRRLQEYLGQSYFDYLSKLDDLVLLMDESHRQGHSGSLQAER
jgi:type III restriction enzyme